MGAVNESGKSNFPHNQNQFSPQRRMIACGNDVNSTNSSATNINRQPAISWPAAGKVGMVGVGQLGTAVTCNLVRANLHPVLFDLKPPNAEVQREFLDTGRATWAPSLKSVAEQCDVVLTGLPRPEHVSAALDGANGEDGLLAGFRKGSVWIEHSTTDIENTMRIRDRLEERGVHCVAAPFTGGMQILRAGKMVSLVGCDDEAVFEKIRPLLALSCGQDRIIRCGDFGHETVIKIITNMLCAVQDCAMGEAILIAKKNDVCLKKLFDAVRVSSGNSFCWETEFPRMVDGSYFPDFTAEMMLKDIELGQGLAKKGAVPLPVHAVVAQLYQSCISKFGPNCGSTAPVKLLADQCGVLDCHGGGLADEKLKKAFADWTYTTDIVEGSYVVKHLAYPENPFTSHSSSEKSSSVEKKSGMKAGKKAGKIS